MSSFQMRGQHLSISSLRVCPYTYPLTMCWWKTFNKPSIYSHIIYWKADKVKNWVCLLGLDQDTAVVTWEFRSKLFVEFTGFGFQTLRILFQIVRRVHWVWIPNFGTMKPEFIDRLIRDECEKFILSQSTFLPRAKLSFFYATSNLSASSAFYSAKSAFLQKRFLATTFTNFNACSHIQPWKPQWLPGCSSLIAPESSN